MKKNFRKCFTGILLCLGMLILSGCVKSNIHYTFNEDQTSSVQVSYLVNHWASLAHLGNIDISKMQDDLKSEGFAVQSMTENNNVGFMATKRLSVDETQDITKLFPEVKVTSEKNVVTISGTINKGKTNTPSISAPNDNIDTTKTTAQEENETLQSQGDQKTVDTSSSQSTEGDELYDFAGRPSLNIELTFPKKVISTNAQIISEDGKTVTWPINLDGSTNIEVKASLK